MAAFLGLNEAADRGGAPGLVIDLLSERIWALQPALKLEVQMPEMSPLRHRLIEEATIRNLSPETQRSYISYINPVSKFSRHFGRSPDRLGLEDDVQRRRLGWRGV